MLTPFDLLLAATAALLDQPADDSEVRAVARALQEIAPFLPALLAHGWAHLEIEIAHHQVEGIIPAPHYKTRQRT